MCWEANDFVESASSRFDLNFGNPVRNPTVGLNYVRLIIDRERERGEGGSGGGYYQHNVRDFHAAYSGSSAGVKWKRQSVVKGEILLWLLPK